MCLSMCVYTMRCAELSNANEVMRVCVHGTVFQSSDNNCDCRSLSLSFAPAGELVARMYQSRFRSVNVKAFFRWGIFHFYIDTVMRVH